MEIRVKIVEKKFPKQKLQKNILAKPSFVSKKTLKLKLLLLFIDLGNSFVKENSRHLIFYMVPQNQIREKINERMFKKKSKKNFHKKIRGRVFNRKSTKRYSGENQRRMFKRISIIEKIEKKKSLHCSK